MTTAQLRALLQHLRRIVGRQAGGLADAELLDRFVNEHDEAAFEVLVWRHGPMVLSVCRRMLRHEQDAEDAFQATFLTLVRKARSIGKRQAVASWLYKVAYRIALEAQALTSKRNVREKQDPGALEGKAMRPATDAATWCDLRAVLDEEVHRLPEKYRTPLILCYFQGKTYEQAARELGCPKGTVSIRLMRARELLRPRLERRGLALSGGMLAALLSENATAAAVSKSLVEGTVKAALLFAAGKTAAGVLSGSAIALAEGVLKSMLMTKLKIAAVILLVVGVAGSGAGVLTYGGVAGEPASPHPEKLLTTPANEPRQQTIKPPPPAGEHNERTAAEGERWAREKQAEAEDRYAQQEDRYAQQERRWLKELVAARLKLLEKEDELRMTQPGADPEESAIYARLQAMQKSLEAIRNFENKDDPRVKKFRDEVSQLQQHWDAIKMGRSRDLADARRNFVMAEEELRLLERLQAIQRERAVRNLQAADEQVRRLKGASSRVEPTARGSLELETKVDQLLREIADLRRELRRQQTEQRQQKLPERRPDQP